jgi:hypothetical protein
MAIMDGPRSWSFLPDEYYPGISVSNTDFEVSFPCDVDDPSGRKDLQIVLSEYLDTTVLDAGATALGLPSRQALEAQAKAMAWTYKGYFGTLTIDGTATFPGVRLDAVDIGYWGNEALQVRCTFRMPLTRGAMGRSIYFGAFSLAVLNYYQLFTQEFTPTYKRPWHAAPVLIQNGLPLTTVKVQGIVAMTGVLAPPTELFQIVGNTDRTVTLVAVPAYPIAPGDQLLFTGLTALAVYVVKYDFSTLTVTIGNPFSFLGYTPVTGTNYTLTHMGGYKALRRVAENHIAAWSRLVGMVAPIALDGMGEDSIVSPAPLAVLKSVSDVQLNLTDAVGYSLEFDMGFVQ